MFLIQGQNLTDENGNISEESNKNLEQFIRLAREDLDVQEEITAESEKKLLEDAIETTLAEAKKASRNYSVEGLATVNEVYTIINEIKYNVKMFQGGAIRIYSNDKELNPVKPILREIVEYNKLDIPLDGISTRQMGKRIITILSKQSS